MKRYICRVCGYDNSPDEFWEDDNPTYVICPCCGCESGNEDYTIESVKEYRQKWLDKKTVWFENKLKPDNWVLSEQLEKIPEEYR